jgi:hypothetical protein
MENSHGVKEDTTANGYAKKWWKEARCLSDLPALV